MSNWTAGYMVDINYNHGFYPELTPTLLSLIGLAKGQGGVDLGKELAYCELGCGQGFSANLLAAANPTIQFYANDFNPAQIANANALAAEGGVTNVHFSDASFQEYIDDLSLPQFDIIALHGIYSWISAENRKAVLNFISKKLKVGGLVYLSFNTLPGWSADMPLRRLFLGHAETSGGPLPVRIEKALAYAGQMKDANIAYFREISSAAKRLEGIKSQNPSYVAHEYFNRDWTPLYFSDVAKELAEAKLAYLGSAHLLDHIDGINFTPAHALLLNEVADPIFRETLRDYLTLSPFRSDIFVRGGLPLNAGEAHARWLDIRLALIVDPQVFNFTVNTPLGEALLQRDAYNPIIDALSTGPRTLREIVADPRIQTLGWPKLYEVVKALVGSGQVQPCLEAKGESKRAAVTRRFNEAVMRRALWGGELGGLASPVTGGGVPLNRFDQIFLLAVLERTDPVQRVWSQLQTLGQKLVKDGKTLESDDENLADIRNRYEDFKKSLPVFQQLGIA